MSQTKEQTNHEDLQYPDLVDSPPCFYKTTSKCITPETNQHRPGSSKSENIVDDIRNGRKKSNHYNCYFLKNLQNTCGDELLENEFTSSPNPLFTTDGPQVVGATVLSSELDTINDINRLSMHEETEITSFIPSFHSNAVAPASHVHRSSEYFTSANTAPRRVDHYVTDRDSGAVSNIEKQGKNKDAHRVRDYEVELAKGNSSLGKWAATMKGVGGNTYEEGNDQQTHLKEAVSAYCGSQPTESSCGDQAVGVVIQSHGCPMSGSNNTLSNASAEEPMCRICQEGEEDEILVSPCFCTGTVGRLHVSCLNTWLQITSRTSCELCGYPFPVTREAASLRQYFRHPRANMDLPNLVCDLACLLLLTPLLMSSVYLSSTGALQYESLGRAGSLLAVTTLVLALLLVYISWASLAAVYHIRVWRSWQQRNYVVSKLTHEQIATPDANARDKMMMVANSNGMGEGPKSGSQMEEGRGEAGAGGEDNTILLAPIAKVIGWIRVNNRIASNQQNAA